jgi:hypothetical protein
MDNEQVTTYACGHCGAAIHTSAAPGTKLECKNCGAPFTVPAVRTSALDERPPAAGVEAAAQAPDESQAAVVAPASRGQPQDVPRPDTVALEGEALGRPERPPPPDSPAGVGNTVDSDAVAPTVGRAPSDLAGQEITPAGAGTDEAPTAAELIAEPTKYGVAVPGDQGDPVLVAPNKVVVTPPQAEPAGGPPGGAMINRTNPLLLGGAALGCCLLAGLGAASCFALQVLGLIGQ